MKVADLLEVRRRNWQELERLCDQMSWRRKTKLGAEGVSRFAALYRAACADLALADAYHLPPNTVQYLHRLVGRAHNQLYRSRTFRFAEWGQALMFDVPQRIFNDRCVQWAFCLFWGTFILSAILAYNDSLVPGFAERLVTKPVLDDMETMHGQDPGRAEGGAMMLMAAFYIWNNTGIGLKCFAGGIFVVPGVYILLFNAAYIGAIFGYMARSPSAPYFFNFVTAHGPFELTAIVLSGGAGLRLGVSLLITRGFTRLSSLTKTAKEAMPVMGAAAILFFFAALIEGFISPTGLPYYWVKAPIAVLSSGLLLFYFVVLGFPRGVLGAAR